ncbi:hypothetical protein [Persicobacter sp. CCB-QB2]|uniref:hypothetical protein n=1 Tax=Persicobacter sp. CCB-QB2 TaxID=1561025 RepID=UPI0012FB4D76|nr:hypothetical protein [Persicobacter sp. CCB-QB2]
MEPLALRLKEQGHEVTFLTSEEIFWQKLKFGETHNLISVNSVKSNRSFYLVNSLYQVIIVFKFKLAIRNIHDQFDHLIIGNDGALQRSVIDVFRKHNKKTSMMLDGIITDSSYTLREIFKMESDKAKMLFRFFKMRLKKGLFKLFSRTALNTYLPSEVGWSCVDNIFVIGEYSKRVIERRCCKKTNVFGFGLPRFVKKVVKESQCVKNSIVFFTSAFKWHAKKELHELQVKDIELLITINNNLDESLRKAIIIKVHPRESLDDYMHLLKNENVRLDSQTAPVMFFHESNKLFSNISTCILEGTTYGVNVISMMNHFDYEKYQKSFISSSAIVKTFSDEDVLDILLNGEQGVEEMCYFINTEGGLSDVLGVIS